MSNKIANYAKEPPAPKRPRPAWLDAVRTFKAPRCEACKQGNHLDRCVVVLGDGDCGCWCHDPGEPPGRSVPVLQPLDVEVPWLMEQLRAHGVQCRARAHPHYDLVWRPLVKEWSQELRDALHAHLLDVTRLLYPGGLVKSLWFVGGPLGACVGCGRSSALYDPLGQPRHSACGYLGQPKDLRVDAMSVGQRKARAQG